MSLKQSIQKIFHCLFVLGVTLPLITTSAHADERAEAIDSFMKVSLPNIAMLEPWVEKSKESNFLLIMHEHLFVFQKIS